MRCNNCNDVIPDGEVRWAYEDPFCESCFNDSYTYCSACDSVISRNEVVYNNSDDPLCNDCYSDAYDNDAPDNPEVSDTDREYILTLSRNWLTGKVDHRRFININTHDFFLSEIRTKVGLIDSQINIYGLKEREEYQITVSPDLEEYLREQLPESLKYFSIKSVEGVRRLGLSYNIRRDNRQEIIQLIHSLTVVKVEQPDQLVLV
jgi:LIM domain